MKLLTKDQILGADDRESITVEVPEWGGSVQLIAMTACQRDAFEASIVDLKGGAKTKTNSKLLVNFRARFISSCIVDDNGKRLFTDKDIVELGKKSAKPISRLFDKCQEINGMTDDDVEELEGN